jgi:hypothetical protein
MKSKPIDPRGPRFGATITSVALLVVIWLGLPAASTPQIDAAWWTLVAVTALFAWGAIVGPARHPYGWLFKFLVRPFLSAPEFLEEQAPPRFAQAVGLFVSLVGVVLHLVAIPYALVVAAAGAFIAAFLNAAFGLCLGCEIYAALPKRPRS